MESPKPKTLLDGNVYHVPYSRANLEKIRNDLTVNFKSYKGKNIVIPIYHTTADDVELPRRYGWEHYGKPDLMRKYTGVPIDPMKFQSAYQLLPSQQLCFDAMLQHFTPNQLEFGQGGCICDLPCGCGKTYIGIRFVDYVRMRTLVIGHANIPVAQWVRHFKKIFPKLSVSEYHGGPDLPASDIVVTTIHAVSLDSSINKVGKMKLRSWLCQMGLIIYDEIHIFGSPEYSKVFDLVSSAYQVGLSATPARRDQLECVYELKIGPIIDAEKKLGIKPPKFDVKIFVVRDIPRTSAKRSKTVRCNTSNYAEAVKSITLDYDRAQHLCNLHQELLRKKSDENAIIFCNYHEEVEFLAPIIRERFPTKLVGEIYGTVTVQAVAQFSDYANIIICTFHKAGTAFSPDRFTTGYLYSTTRARTTQGIGRIMRWRDGDDEWNRRTRHFYDFADRETVAASQFFEDTYDPPSLSRKKIYTELGYEIIYPATVDNCKEKEAAMREKASKLGL